MKNLINWILVAAIFIIAFFAASCSTVNKSKDVRKSSVDSTWANTSDSKSTKTDSLNMNLKKDSSGASAMEKLREKLQEDSLVVEFEPSDSGDYHNELGTVIIGPTVRGIATSDFESVFTFGDGTTIATTSKIRKVSKKSKSWQRDQERKKDTATVKTDAEIKIVNTEVNHTKTENTGRLEKKEVVKSKDVKRRNGIIFGIVVLAALCTFIFLLWKRKSKSKKTINHEN